VENLVETFRHLTEAEFDAIVETLTDRRRRVHIIGGRFTDSLALHLAAHLRVVRSGVSHVSGQAANWRDQMIDMGPRDVLVVFDIRRYQDDLHVFAEAASRRGVTLILFTDQWLSPIARLARHVVAARVQVSSRWDSMTAILGLTEAVLAAATERTWDESSRRIASIEALKSGGRS
ncbi:MAG TPA: MurR/RpiR family transcriptional regulator, partial [Methylomirabilota bacterium]|nr:MurR/RpiR family transcriptional regulator [Methylomirabilota bacterium]